MKHGSVLAILQKYYKISSNILKKRSSNILKKRLTDGRLCATLSTFNKISVFFFMLKNSENVLYGGGNMRTRITLACTECKQRNYNTTKDKKTHPERMELKKYCRFCRTHTVHKETK